MDKKPLLGSALICGARQRMGCATPDPRECGLTLDRAWRTNIMAQLSWGSIASQHVLAHVQNFRRK